MKPKLKPFARLIKIHMAKGARPSTDPKGFGCRWETQELADVTGVDARAVRFWRSATTRPKSLRGIERAFFGSDLNRHYADVVALRLAYAKGGPIGEVFDAYAGLTPLTVRLVPTSESLGQLGSHELDRLPITPMITVHSVAYGDGARVINIPGEALRWLPLDARQVLATGEYGGPARFLPADLNDLGGADDTGSLFLPRNFRVNVSCKEPDYGVQLYTCTDMPYGAQPLYPAKWPLTVNGVLGRGGISAFVNRNGKLLPRDKVGLGGELGCAALLTLVAFRGREPISRTAYFVVVRKGIRFPDDCWRSKVTGAPILSPSESIESSRFVFQSWEAKGQSKDLFVADFNGQRMCNLNEGDEAALETFDDDDGREIIRWVDKERIQFCTNAAGNGFGEIVTRRDCAAE